MIYSAFTFESKFQQTLADQSASEIIDQKKKSTKAHTHQERLGDDIFKYFQVMLHRFVFGVGTLHLLISKEAEQ